MNFAWLKSIAVDCNHKLGTPEQHCAKVLDKSVKYCERVLGAVSRLCDVSYLASATCDSTKAFDTFCGVSEFVDDCILATVRRRLKEFSERVKAMMYVEMYIHQSYLFSANASRSASQVAAGIVTEIRNRADPLLTWLSWSSCVTSLFLLLIIFRAKYYQHMYETRSRFDNRYVTKELRDLDLKRQREGRETILPLNRREKAKYINITSFRLLSSERTYLSRSVVFMTITTFKLLIHMVADYSLYWVLMTIRYYGSFQTPLHAELPKSAFHVSGYGFVSRLIKSIISVLEIPLIDSESSGSCLPNPHPPDFRRYMQIGVLIFMLWFFALFEPYGLRLRHVIMSHYRPERARERAMWLYNHILRTRGSFMKFARRKLHREYKYKAETKSTFRMCVYTYLRFDWLRSLLGATCEELKCLLCGITQSKYDLDTQMIRCKSKGCPGSYCSSCFTEIGQLCTICLSPKDYGDISDVSLEKGSSDESSESEEDDNDETRNLIRHSNSKAFQFKEVNKEENTVQQNKVRKYGRLFPKSRGRGEDKFAFLPYTGHAIKKPGEDKGAENSFTVKNHNRINSIRIMTHIGRNSVFTYHSTDFKQSNCKSSQGKPCTRYAFIDLNSFMSSNSKELQHITECNICVSRIKVTDTLATAFINSSGDKVYKNDGLLLLMALSIVSPYVQKLNLHAIKFQIRANIRRRSFRKRRQANKIRVVSSLKDLLAKETSFNLNSSITTCCFRNKKKKSEGINKRNNRAKKKTKKDTRQKETPQKAQPSEPGLKSTNRSYMRGFKNLSTICWANWDSIKFKATSPNKYHEANTKLQSSDEKKNYKRRKKVYDFFRSKRIETKKEPKKKNTDEARKLRISAYFLDQDWFKRKYEINSKKNFLDNATSDPAADLANYKKLLTLKKTPPMYQLAKVTNSGVLRIDSVEDESCCTDCSYNKISRKHRSKLNVTKKALQRFRERIKSKLSRTNTTMERYESSVTLTKEQGTGDTGDQDDVNTERYVEYIPSIMSHEVSIDEIFEETETNCNDKNTNSCRSEERICPRQQCHPFQRCPCDSAQSCNECVHMATGGNSADKHTSACHKWMNVTRALSDRLVNVGVKTPIRMIKDLCVSLFDSSSSGETTSKFRKLDKASKGVVVSPEVRSFCCQHVEEKATRDHTTQIEKTTPKTLQWAVQNSSCDSTMNINKMTCTCATQHHVKNRNIGTWLGHHCNDLHRAANEHKRKTAVGKPKSPRRSFVPRIISEVFDISHAGAESSLNTTDSSANYTLVCSKSESSFNSNDTRTDTTICSIATVEYHEERKYKRRQPKTAVVTKANRSTLTDKAKVCDVSTITNDWWSPIVERKVHRKEKEIYLEKKKGDYTMNEKVHKRLRNKGITTDGRIVTFRSRTQVIPPGITDIMSPSRYLLESQRYYNELFSSRFYTPQVYAITPVQKYQNIDKNRSSASIRHHTRRGHKNKKYDESYSKKSDSIKAGSPRKRLQPNLFKQNKIYRSTPRPHHWKKLKAKKKQGQDIHNNMDEIT